MRTNEQTARDMMVDFIGFVLVVVVSVGLFYYVVTGGSLIAFNRVFHGLGPIAVFFLPLAFTWRVRLRDEIIRTRKIEIDLDEILVYLAPGDLKRDFFVNSLAGLILLAVAWLEGNLGVVDYFQAGLMVSVMTGWHYYLYSQKKTPSQVPYLSRLDKIKDEIVIFFQPIIILAIAAAPNQINILDYLQVVCVFLILYWRHFRFFSIYRDM